MQQLLVPYNHSETQVAHAGRWRLVLLGIRRELGLPGDLEHRRQRLPPRLVEHLLRLEVDVHSVGDAVDVVESMLDTEGT